MPNSGRPSMPSGRPIRAWLEMIVRQSSASPGQLAGAPGHHHAAARLRGVTRRLEPVAHELEDLLHPRADDSQELGFRHMARMIHVVAEPVDGDQLAIVRRRGEAGAVKRLQALGVAHRHIQPAGDIPRDVNPADGDSVDMDQPPGGEHADSRRSAAEIDDRRAKFGLVVDQRRKARGVGRRDHGLDPKMTSLDHQHEVARRRRVAGGDMEVDPELLANHAFRIVYVLASRRGKSRSAAHAGPSFRGARSRRRPLPAPDGCRVRRRFCRAAGSWR